MLVATISMIAAACGEDSGALEDALDETSDGDSTGIEQGAAESSDEAGDSDSPPAGAPVSGIIEAGENYEFAVPDAGETYRLTVPAGSIMSASLSAAADNISPVSIGTNDGYMSLTAEPGGTESIEAAVITPKEETHEAQLSVIGSPGDLVAFTIDIAAQPEDPAGGDAPSIITDAPALAGTGAGILGSLDALDYFSLDVAAGDVISWSISQAGDGTGGVDASLEYNGERRAGLSAVPGGSDEGRVLVSQEEDGEWFLRVAGFGTYEATVTTAPQPDGGQDGDAGGTIATALAVEPGTFAALLGDNDDGDFFGFEVADGGTVSLQISVTADSASNVAARLLVNGEELGRVSANPGGTSDLLDISLEGGSAAEGVIETWGNDASYEITLVVGVQEDGGEAGDAGADEASARQIEPGTFDGSLSRNDRADMYTLSSVSGGDAQITLASAPEAGRFSFRVLGPDGELGRDAAAAGQSATLDFTVDPATTIYIEVWNTQGAYEITLGGAAFPATSSTDGD